MAVVISIGWSWMLSNQHITKKCERHGAWETTYKSVVVNSLAGKATWLTLICPPDLLLYWFWISRAQNQLCSNRCKGASMAALGTLFLFFFHFTYNFTYSLFCFELSIIFGQFTFPFQVLWPLRQFRQKGHWL